MHEVTLWSQFSMEKYLTQARQKGGGGGVGPASMSGQDRLVDFPMETLPSLRCGCGEGGENKRGRKGN